MSYLRKRTWVVYIAYLSNVLSAVAYTILYTTVYSIGLSLYPREQNMYVAYIGTGSALGISIAPAIASVFIPMFDYHWMFFSYGILIIMSTIYVIIVMNDLEDKLINSEKEYCEKEFCDDEE
jgi:MFS family permease